MTWDQKVVKMLRAEVNHYTATLEHHCADYFTDSAWDDSYLDLSKHSEVEAWVNFIEDHHIMNWEAREEVKDTETLESVEREILKKFRQGDDAYLPLIAEFCGHFTLKVAVRELFVADKQPPSNQITIAADHEDWRGPAKKFPNLAPIRSIFSDVPPMCRLGPGPRNLFF